MSGVDRLVLRRPFGRPFLIISTLALKAMVVAGELGLVLLTAVASGVSYHLAVYGTSGPVRTFAAVGGLAGLFYVLPFISQGEYAVSGILLTVFGYFAMVLAR